MRTWFVQAEFIPDTNGGHLRYNNVKFVDDKTANRNAFARIVQGLKDRGMIPQDLDANKIAADCVRIEQTLEVSHGG